jgi:hypothetical protein
MALAGVLTGLSAFDGFQLNDSYVYISTAVFGLFFVISIFGVYIMFKISTVVDNEKDLLDELFFNPFRKTTKSKLRKQGIPIFSISQNMRSKGNGFRNMN